jgi:NAD(P)-dependent dehydrogenase (short-subunit alcohol dehydrogenase family)
LVPFAGRATALTLAACGATLVCGCRDAAKGAALGGELAQVATSQQALLVTPPLELSDLGSVRAFATEVLANLASGEWPPLHALILNAGIISLQPQFDPSGMESTFRTNHLGHWLLTQLLLPQLRAAAPSRVVVVGSASHFGPIATEKRELSDETVWLDDVIYPQSENWSIKKGNAAYGSSKLANQLFASELHRRESTRGSGVVACCLHPGNMMATDIGRGNVFVNLLMKAGGLLGLTRNMSQGAATTVLCTLVDPAWLQGNYWADCAPATPSWRAQGETGEAAATTLWSLSAQLVEVAEAGPEAVVLAGKGGAWCEVKAEEEFGAGHTFSMNLSSGKRFVLL